MKKLYITIIAVLCCSYIFAETSFWGIPFGKTEKEIKNIERNVETKIQEELKGFGGTDLTIGYGTNNENKIQSIRFSFALRGDIPVKMKSVLDVYFFEKLGCKLVNGTYYNDSIIATIGLQDNCCVLFVSDRNAFESAINKF